MSVTKEKTKHKYSTWYIYIFVIAHFLDKYDRNIQADIIPLLYKEKLALFYNACNKSFLNTKNIF